MSAKELFKEGKLSEAVVAATQAVKAKPTDVTARGYLCELLCFAGDLDRADAQLDAISQLDPKAAVGVSLFRHLLRGEQARRQFLSEGRVPEFLKQPSQEMQLRLQASIALREGGAAGYNSLLQEAERLRPRIQGSSAGEAFDDLRDLDDLAASFFEVFTTNGKYYWVPMSEIELMEFHPPERLRDLLWRRTHMIVRDGPDGEVYIPVLYPNSHTHPDEKVKLGRATEWETIGAGAMRGVGQRVVLLGESDLSIMELKSIEFTAQPAPAV